MKGIFQGRNAAALGIDIRSGTLSVLELGYSSTQCRVLAYATEPLPAGAVEGRRIEDFERVGDVLARALARAAPRSTKAVVAVAGAAVISKVILLPVGLGDDDIEHQLKREAEQYIPYPLEEASIDFEVCSGAAGGQGQVEVLFAACRKASVEPLEAVLAHAGLAARVVEVDTFALARACRAPGGGRQPVVAVVDIDAMSTVFSVLHDGQSLYCREYAIGEPARSDGVQPCYDALLALIHEGLQQVFGGGSVRKLDQLWLAGRAATLPGLAEWVGGCLQVPTRAANPFATMTLAPQVDIDGLAADAPSLLVACGLAMRGLGGWR